MRGCYPCLPLPLVYFGVPNDGHEKATIKWLVFNVLASVVIVAFHAEPISPTLHIQKLHRFARG